MAETTEKPSLPITVGCKERLEDAVSFLAPEFVDDALFIYLLHSMSDAERGSYLPSLFRRLLKACVLNEAMVMEVGGWGAASVLMPPGKKLDGPLTVLRSGLIPLLFEVGLAASKRIVFEYTAATDKAKSQVLSRQELKNFWYIFIMATSSKRRRQGLASMLLKRMQQEARRDGRVLWLEATSAQSRNLYATHGFQIALEIPIGKGEVGRDGRTRPGGEGVLIWGMFWRPGKDDGV